MEGLKKLREKSLSMADPLATCAVCMSQFVVSHLLYLEFCTSGCIFFSSVSYHISDRIANTEVSINYTAV